MWQAFCVWKCEDKKKYNIKYYTKKSKWVKWQSDTYENGCECKCKKKWIMNWRMVLCGGNFPFAWQTRNFKKKIWY